MNKDVDYMALPPKLRKNKTSKAENIMESNLTKLFGILKLLYIPRIIDIKLMSMLEFNINII